MLRQLVKLLLLAAVVVAGSWLVARPGPEPLVTMITALVALLTLWRPSGEVPRRWNTADARHRVAVLPLENISASNEREYFATGLTEELISVISKIGGLRVIARSSVVHYRERPRPISEIGRELRVDSVLEGSVRLADESLRVSVRLVDVASEAHLWSEDYDRTLIDVFSVQRDIAMQVAKALEVSIVGSEARRLAQSPTTDLEAYDLYLLARYDLNKRTEEGLLRAIERFKLALSRDPRFAAAYAGIADAYVLATIGYASIPFEVATGEAKAASSEALRIRETLSDAHTSRGWVLLNHEWDFEGAEAEFRRAIELNPSDARAYQWYAQCFMYQGRLEEAVALSERAQELDPRSALIAVEAGWYQYYLGRNEEALVRYRQAIGLDPALPLPHFNIGNIHECEGRIDEALTEYTRAAEMSGNAPMYLAFRARALALLGERRGALDALEEVVQAANRGAPTSVYVAHVYDALGQPGDALDWLEQAAEKRETMILAAGSTWLPFPSLQGHPRYEALLSRLPGRRER